MTSPDLVLWLDNQARVVLRSIVASVSASDVPPDDVDIVLSDEEADRVLEALNAVPEDDGMVWSPEALAADLQNALLNSYKSPPPVLQLVRDLVARKACMAEMLHTLLSHAPTKSRDDRLARTPSEEMERLKMEKYLLERSARRPHCSSDDDPVPDEGGKF